MSETTTTAAGGVEIPARRIRAVHLYRRAVHVRRYPGCGRLADRWHRRAEQLDPGITAYYQALRDAFYEARIG